MSSTTNSRATWWTLLGILALWRESSVVEAEVCLAGVQFSCGDLFQCIPSSWRCDGEPDCRDFSDEDGCGDVTCSSNAYLCPNSSRCIPRGWLCDGASDCDDDSDENFSDEGLSCSTTPVPFVCPSNHVRCPGTEICVHVTKICNRVRDCPAGHDEGPFCISENQPKCFLHNCNYRCKDTIYGAMCYCEDGYQVVNVNQCEDVNECSDYALHGCDQGCTNSNGSYSCSCGIGYQLQKDRKTCIPINGEPAQLFIANSTNILKLSLKGVPVEGVDTPAALGAMALDYDMQRGRVCWINYADVRNELKCADAISLSGRNTLPVGFNIRHIQQFAIDWVSGNMYFTDDTSKRILVSNREADKYITLIDSDMEKPHGIGLDPIRGLLFFTDRGQHPKIKRAYMNGSDCRDIVTAKISTPHGITVDLPLARLYWSDSGLQLIESSDYEGRNRRALIRGQQIPFGFGIAVIGIHLYVTNWHDQPQLLKINKFNGSVSVMSTVISKSAGAVKVYHQTLQPIVGKHPCAEANGGCDHICLLSGKEGNGKLCRCLSGYRLENDTRCIENRDTSQFLIYGQSFPGSIHGIPMELLGSNHETIVPIENLNSPRAVDYDAKEEYIYYADTNNFVIERQKIDGTGHQTLLSDRISNCEGLAVDWISRNLYWTDDDLQIIQVARLNGSARKVILSDNVTHFRAIVVDPVHGYLYFSDWAEDPDDTDLAKIERAYMDGSNREVFVSNDILWPNGLSIDSDRGMLYWCDAFFDNIQGVALNGSGIRLGIVYSDKLLHPFGLDFYGSFIFWTDYTKGTVYKYDRTKDYEPLTTLLSTGGVLFELRVYDPERQTGTNACSNNNGDCQELCLPIPHGDRCCSCQDGYKLEDDGLQCSPDPDYVIPDLCGDGFECNNGHCVSIEWVCDGDDDCGDRSDERSSICNGTSCSLHEFRCRNANCIPLPWLCDGQDDCIDGYRSDEARELCSGHDCNPSQFRCSNDRCILKLWRCDDEDDCGDNSDEVGCSQSVCNLFEFRCDNHHCIAMEFVCNRGDDCGDLSDERNCSYSCSNETKFECKTSHQCIDKQLECNGYEDCLDGSDEANCTDTDIVNICRSTTQFSCRTGYCIPAVFVCDGQDDCGNGKDEHNCAGSTCSSDSHFFCKNETDRMKNCIPLTWQCDGRQDCADGSDEFNCTDESCSPGFWRCPNHTLCIPYSNICDGQHHCVDGADEVGLCFEHWCTNKTFPLDRQCTHGCQNMPSGRMCTCPEGYHLLNTDNRCEPDTRMCVQRGRCSQRCVNGKGTYSCQCYDGYGLQADQSTCRSTDPAIPYLIFSNRNQLRRINLKTQDYNVLVFNLRNTIALDFSYNTSEVFWTDIVDDKIYKGFMDTNTHNAGLRNIEEVVGAGLATAEGLAVDWVAGNLYWVESQLDQIEVAKLNGSYRTTVIAGKMKNPRAIALDPREGLMFWTDWDASNPRIERSTMAGLDRSTIFGVLKVNGGWPNGLTLDYLENRVYWIDARSDSIHSVLYDGTIPFTILQGHEFLYHPFALTIFEATVYWTDWRTNAVYGANKWTGANITQIQKTTTQPFDLHVFHPQRQPTVSAANNSCAVNNSGCSHLCLLDGHKAKCLCPHLMRVDEDQKNCIDDNVFFVISVPTKIHGVNLNDGYHNVIPPLTIPSVANASSVAHDVTEQRLYWTDLQHKSINRAYINGTAIQTVIEGMADSYSLTIDWLSRNMYWISVSSSEKSSLNIARLDGSYRYEIPVDDLAHPRSLVIRPAQGLMYWINAGDSPTIESAKMDGSDQVKLVSSILQNPTGLAVDDGESLLYWTDAGLGQIWTSRLNGLGVMMFLDLHGAKPIAIALTDSHVYWAETDLVKYVSKTNKSQIQVLRNDLLGIKDIFLYDPTSNSGDTNSCFRNQGNCSQLCIPVGTNQRVCACTAGYTLQDDGRNCQGVESFLIYSLDTSIRGIGLNSSHEGDLLIPITGHLLSVAIDFDAVHNYIYWVDTSVHTINRIQRDHTNREVLISRGLGRVEGLTVDWIAGNMYWTDQQLDVIEVARVDGTFRSTLISEDLDKPRAIVVEPVSGYLFWADWGATPKIERSRLDGTMRTLIKEDDIGWPNGLTLDYKARLIYWCDAYSDKIYHMRFDGNDTKIVKSDNIEDPFAITVFQDYIYWTDRSFSGGSIQRASKVDGSKPLILLDNLGLAIKDVHVFSKQRQIGTSACAVNNGGCEQLCFSTGGSNRTCSCTYGLLDEDGVSCKEYSAYILYSQGGILHGLNLNGSTDGKKPIEPIGGDHIRNVIGLAVDFKQQKLFYTDIQQGSIHEIYFNRTGHRHLINNTGSAEGIAYDPIFHEIYWTSYTNSSISRMRVDVKDAPEQVLVRLAADDHPRGIALDVCKGYLFWSNWNSENPSISRSSVNGSNVVNIISTDIQTPNGIVVDHISAKLFWCDASLDKIERTNYNGSDRYVILSIEPYHPFGLAILGDYIYWTDWVKRSVIRANKFTGGDVVVLEGKLRQQPMGLVIVAENVTDCTQWPCKMHNGGCDDVCNTNAYGEIQCSCYNDRVQVDKSRCLDGNYTCGLGEFVCDDGQCIPYEGTCDGIAQCSNKSDERDSYCQTRDCERGYFRCGNGRCISNVHQCDQFDNCGDNSDEYRCDQCKRSEFRCDNGRCIPENHLCNAHLDCADHSDETRCPSITCADWKLSLHLPPHLDLISCNLTSICIAPSMVCDGIDDCGNGTDENDCKTGVSGCPNNFYSCPNRECIRNSWVCDRDNDCVDGADEKENCTYTCEDDQFQCTDNQCIPNKWRCDGDSDCLDNSDEETNCQEITCGPDHFRCSSMKRCIPRTWMCDGDNDCGDAEDENQDNGCNVTRCETNEYACLNYRCIQLAWVCDRDDDCGDGSDEPDACVYSTCQPDQFSCNNGQCIHKNWVCDQQKDCSDGSDELNCSTTHPSTEDCDPDSPGAQFRCNNNQCISVGNVCDDTDHCGDQSDETNCGINECEISFPCHHMCQDLNTSYVCSCYDGFTLLNDSSTCEDVNECVDVLPCSQGCLNSQGSYRCYCADGYANLPDNADKCIHVEEDPAIVPKVIFSNRHYIRSVELTGNNHKQIAVQLTNAVALDFDYQDEWIYWSDVTQQDSTISRMPMNGTSREVLHLGILNPDGLAVDWIGRNLYWCDKGLEQIGVSTLDGHFRRVLIKEGLDEPRAIVLDPRNGLVYWTDWGTVPYIGRASMDGTDAQPLVKDHMRWPNGLTIDYTTDRVFWADAHMDRIEFVEWDGRNRQVVIDQGIPHIFAISLFEDWLIWSDWENKTIVRANKYTGKDRSILATTIQRPMDIQVYHPLRQPIGLSNPCQIDNGGCSDLCLLNAKGTRTCACPTNFYLSPDEMTCVSNCTYSQFICSNEKCVPFWWKCDGDNDCGDYSDEPSDCRPFYCAVGHYQCANSTKDNEACVNPSYICDGVNDCPDESDEKNCELHTCMASQWKCNESSRCIAVSFHCDGTVHCSNGEDERDCALPECRDKEFACTNGQCVPEVWKCDGVGDCSDDSDEPSTCGEKLCPENQFTCSNKHCVPERWRCDGENDCLDNSDELNCGNLTCAPDHFQCRNFRCIPKTWRCDTDNDCQDGSDEQYCDSKCTTDQYKCTNNDCIPANLKCDGEPNCPDGSDERDSCDAPVTCTDNEFHCDNNQCIWDRWHCDGDQDCSDGSDEHACSKRQCLEDQFQCNNTRCIPRRWRCDGEDDCGDSSDEVQKICVFVSCLPPRFRCRSTFICIYSNLVCNGVDNCGDGSDEEADCATETSSCQPEEFKCKNHNCVLRSKMCNNIDDCGDLSDERECNAHSNCSIQGNDVCEDICTDLDQDNLSGFSCSCREGFQLHDNGRSCLDVNECDQPGWCSQMCDNLQGSFNCSCREGYIEEKLDGHRILCKAEGPPEFIVIADNGKLQHYYPGSNRFSLEYTDGFGTDSVDIFYSENKLYMVNSEAGTISTRTVNLEQRTRRNTDVQVQVVLANLTEPQDIAIDWVSNKIYWVDPAENLIQAWEIDQQNKVTILSEWLDQPYSIVVDPKSGWLFWSEVGNHAKVSRVDMDGYNSLVISREVQYPCGLSLDYVMSKLYWADSKASCIQMADLTGDNVRVVVTFSAGQENPFAIDVFGDWIYGTTKPSSSIFRANKFGRTGEGSDFTILAEGFASAPDLVIIQKQKQERGLVNPCLPSSCIPHAVCLLKPGGYTCSCIQGYRMVSDECQKMPLPPPRPSVCETVPCANGATCIVIRDRTPKCRCTPQYHGTFCNIDRCHNYCLNNGTCTIDSATFAISCQCPNTYKGPRCGASRCDAYCNSRGTCYENSNGTGLVCVCKSIQYIGAKCEMDRCDNYCQNGGVCTTGNKTTPVICKCASLFSGNKCEIEPPNPCILMECKNSAKCHQTGPNEAECNCTSPRYSGTYCSIDGCEKCTKAGKFCQLSKDGALCALPPIGTPGTPGSTDENKRSRSSVSMAVAIPIILILIVAIVLLFMVWYRKRSSGFKHHRMKQEDGNVEIGNPTFMYDPQLNGDDEGPQLIDAAFTVKGHKANNFSNPMYGSLYADRQSTGSEMSLEEKKDLLDDTETMEDDAQSLVLGRDDDEQIAILR